MIQSSMTNNRTLRLLESISIVLLLLTLLCIIFNYPQLPAQIPSRFDFSGEVSAKESKSGLWILWFVMLALYFIMSILYVLPLSSRWVNLPQHIKDDTTGRGKTLAYEMMAWLKLLNLLIFASIILMIVQQAQGNNASGLFITVILLTSLGSLVILGIYMSKMAQFKPQEISDAE